MSYLLEGEVSFDSSHYLRGHNGKCRNLHGHRWRICYGIKSDKLISNGSSEGMIIDFSHMKYLVNEYFETYDHALIVTKDKDGFSKEEERFIKSCRDMNFKMVEIPCRSTAENMSRIFFCELGDMLSKKIGDENIIIDYITVYETPSNAATYREE